MAFLFALVPWAGFPIGYLFLDKEQGVLEQYLANLADVGFLGIVVTIIGLVVTGGAMLEVLDHKLTAFIAGLGLAVDLLCLLVFPHTEAIASWIKTNGLLGNGIYLGLLLVTILVNRRCARELKVLDEIASSARITRQGEKEDVAVKVNGASVFIPVNAIIAPLLMVPSVVLYIYDGFANIDTKHMSQMTPNLDVLHWSFAIKISCVFLIIVLLRYLLPAISKGSPLGWVFLAGILDLAALAFVYLLLERALYPLVDGLLTTVLLYFPMLIISGFFHFYAYIFFLVCLINFISPGAVRRWRLSNEAAAQAKVLAGMDKADMEQRLDAEERILNALSGTGPYTDEEALARGSISTQEYLTGQIYREQKLNK